MFTGRTKAEARARIEARADECGFRVMDYEIGPGSSAHVTLRDDRTDDKIQIQVWPDTTEEDLTYLLTRAAFELRGGYRVNDCQHEWMM